MILLEIMIITAWIAVLIFILALIAYKVILPKYHTTISEVSFVDLLTVLNATINTELELWEKDIFKEVPNVVGTNSRFENYYIEISNHIVKSLSPIFFQNMSKYITEEEVISIIGRRVKIFLTEHS